MSLGGRTVEIGIVGHKEQRRRIALRFLWTTACKVNGLREARRSVSAAFVSTEISGASYARGLPASLAGPAPPTSRNRFRCNTRMRYFRFIRQTRTISSNNRVCSFLPSDRYRDTISCTYSCFACLLTGNLSQFGLPILSGNDEIIKLLDIDALIVYLLLLVF